jgi:hypothetical protein
MVVRAAMLDLPQVREVEQGRAVRADEPFRIEPLAEPLEGSAKYVGGGVGEVYPDAVVVRLDPLDFVHLDEHRAMPLAGAESSQVLRSSVRVSRSVRAEALAGGRQTQQAPADVGQLVGFEAVSGPPEGSDSDAMSGM